MSGNLSGRNFDATELSEMTERSVNERGVQQAREQLRKSAMGSAISAVNAACLVLRDSVLVSLLRSLVKLSPHLS